MKLLCLLLFCFLSLNTFAKPVLDHQEEILQCYFHSEYLPDSFAKVIVLKASKNCNVKNNRKLAISHLKNSEIEGLLREESINCFTLNSKTIENINYGLTRNIGKIFESIKRLNTSPPVDEQLKGEINKLLLGGDHIEKISWFFEVSIPECSYVYVIDPEPVGHSAGYSRQHINYNMIFFIFALSPFLSLVQ